MVGELEALLSRNTRVGQITVVLDPTALEDRAGDGHAEAAADDAEHREHARGDPGFVDRTAFIAALVIGDIVMAMPMPSSTKPSNRSR